MESPINRSVRAGVHSVLFSPSGAARQTGQGCQRRPIWVAKTVVPKVGPFTWCAKRQHAYRAEVFYSKSCLRKDGRCVVIRKGSTPHTFPPVTEDLC